MSISKATSHYNRQVWEDSNFPILCNTCLGDNKFVRMMIDKYGSECKICQRPFTTFRWNPGAKMRYKKTEVCQTCAKAKNVCQTCLLDLQYGLPVQVRDSVLGTKQDLPKDEVNREYYNQQLDQAMSQADPSEPWGPHKSQPPSDVLAKLARAAPYYKRNRAHICSFWVKGECRRGEECPYRHEKPTDPDDPLSDQNIKDRYYGTNDPVAEKLLKRASELPRPIPPEDKSITTLYVGNIGPQVTEKDLRDHFYQFGEIRSVHVASKQNCAFVTFTTREAAETAIDRSFQKLVIHGQKLSVRWGRSQGKKVTSDPDQIDQLPFVPGLPSGPLGTSIAVAIATSTCSTVSSSTSIATIPSLPVLSAVYYPSQDPQQLGSMGVKLPSFNKD